MVDVEDQDYITGGDTIDNYVVSDRKGSQTGLQIVISPSTDVGMKGK